MEEKRKVSRNKRESNDRFDAKTYTMKSIKFRNEELEALKKYCESHGITVNGFVRETLMDAIKFNVDKK